MSNINTTTPTHSNEPTAPDYAVPDPQEAWERFDRLVNKVLDVPKHTATDEDSQGIKADCRQEVGSQSGVN